MFSVWNWQNKRKSNFNTPKWEILNIKKIFTKVIKIQDE